MTRVVDRKVINGGKEITRKICPLIGQTHRLEARKAVCATLFPLSRQVVQKPGMEIPLLQHFCIPEEAASE